MAKHSNSGLWIAGIIVVVLLLVGGGSGILFGTERGKCLKSGGEWVDDTFTGGKFCLKQTASQFKSNCEASRGIFKTIDSTSPDYVTDQLGGQNYCTCIDGGDEIRFNPKSIFYGCGFAFAD